MKKTAKKSKAKPNLLVELTKRKMELQNSGAIAESKTKFQKNKGRNVNTSSVGPAWGPRKGN
ncbi:MAG: hypothetical protein H7328_03650 [Bdellovibrio sp.]|nr:hypothetical protein [Bdellovibrio sp.]